MLEIAAQGPPSNGPGPCEADPKTGGRQGARLDSANPMVDAVNGDLRGRDGGHVPEPGTQAYEGADHHHRQLPDVVIERGPEGGADDGPGRRNPGRGKRSLWLAGLAGLALAVLPQATPAKACGEEGVAVQVLGSGGPIADDARAGSGFLVWQDGRARALVDAGGGTFVRFGEAGARLADLELIALTHLPTDHAAGLPAILKGGYFSDRERPDHQWSRGKRALPRPGKLPGRAVPSRAGRLSLPFRIP